MGEGGRGRGGGGGGERDDGTNIVLMSYNQHTTTAGVTRRFTG